MDRRNKPLIKRIDWFLIILYLIMVTAGWFSICGATYDFNIYDLFSMGSRPMQQVVWIGLAIVIGIIIITIDQKIYEQASPFIYFAMLIVLAATIVLAPNIKGSHSWLVIGPLRLQPAEFAKISTAMMLAFLFNQYEYKLDSLKSYLQVFAIVGAPILLILLQNETGSALVFFTFFLALYREGFNGVFLGLAGTAVVLFVTAMKLSDSLIFGNTQADVWSITMMIAIATMCCIAVYTKKVGKYFWLITIGGTILANIATYIIRFWYPIEYIWANYLLLLWLIGWLLRRSIVRLKKGYLFIAMFSLGSLLFFHSVDYVFDEIMQPHQQMRIKVALGIEDDIKGSGYNVNQSKIAIGSGGLSGKGFLKGTQTKLKYVPEQATDFIYCTIGEEQGFVGSSITLILFALMILRIIFIAERQSSTYARVYAYCVASILLFHVTINVGMVIGIVPVIGIPLPFFSYGGSSLWGFSILLFLLISLDARRIE
ncbi:rod shape-determining protein RodA [Falsiporphyromonas endometrii]|uniref:Cell wall polymerase n=1 Tax=Falsiporphyromonas endometrii TaxID=1387297 RepID=A0ABV9K9W5_9PORP